MKVIFIEDGFSNGKLMYKKGTVENLAPIIASRWIKRGVAKRFVEVMSDSTQTTIRIPQEVLEKGARTPYPWEPTRPVEPDETPAVDSPLQKEEIVALPEEKSSEKLSRKQKKKKKYREPIDDSDDIL